MSRRRRILLGSVAAAGVGLLVLLWALPEIVRRVALDQIPRRLGRAAAIEDVDLNLFTGRLALRGFRLAEAAGPEAFVELDGLELRLAPLRLLAGEVRVRGLTLARPRVRVVRLEPGRYNFSDILERLAAGERAPAGPSRWTVTLERLVLQHGELAVEDRAVSPSADWSLRNLGFDGADLSTRAGAAPGRLALHGDLGRAVIDLQLERLRLAPLAATARLRLTGFDLRRVAAYVPPGTPVLAAAGALELDLGAALATEGGRLSTLELGGRIALQDLALSRPGGAAPFATAPRVALEIRKADVLARDVALARLAVEGLELRAAREPDGRLDLLEPFQARPAAPGAGGASEAAAEAGGTVPPRGAAPRVLLERLTLRDVRVTLEDRALTPARPWRLGPLEADGAGLSTSPQAPPGALSLRATVHGAAAGPGARLSIEARELRLAPVGAAARLELDGVDLGWLAPYLPPDGPLRVAGGRLRLEAEVRYARDAAGRGKLSAAATARLAELGASRPGDPAVAVALPALNLRLTASVEQGPAGLERAQASGSLGLTALALSRAGEPAPFFTLPGLALDLGRLDLVGRVAHVTSLSLDGPDLAVVRERDGAIDLLRLARAPAPGDAGAAPSPPPPPAAASAPAARPWQLALDRLSLRRGRLGFVDRGTAPATSLVLADLGVTVERLSWPSRHPLTFSIGAAMPGGGRTEVSGQLRLDPFEGQVVARTLDAPIEPYAGYFPFPARLGGLFSGDSVTEFERRGDRYRIASRGRAWARDVSVGAPGVAEPVARMARFEIRGIDFSWPNYALVERVTLQAPQVRVERDREGRVNLRELFTPREPAGAAPPPPAGAAPAAAPAAPAGGEGDAGRRPGLLQTMVLDFREIALEDGFVRFLDRTTSPAFSQDLDRLRLTVRDLSNVLGRHRTSLVAQGLVGGRAALDLRGDLSGIGESLSADLVGEIKDFPLASANPYAEDLVSWIITRGTLSTKVHYRVEGDRLTAEHAIRLDRIDVQKARSEDEARKRLGLPLGLIVAMLKDSRGDISFELPLNGRLSDRSFNWGEMIWAGIKQVIGKVLLSPFRAIGRLFAGREDDPDGALAIDAVTFAGGSAVVSPEMERHLTRVADFLRRSPYVKLALTPVVTAADVQTLKSRALLARIETFAEQRGIRELPAAIAAYYLAQGLPGPAPKSVDEQLTALREREPAPEARLHELAERRQRAIQDHLDRAEGIPAARLAAKAPQLEPDGRDPGRVELNFATD
jgi:uncharacterized protein involved in outer membrane biogenesis